MKKSVIAAAVLSAAGIASAQSSVQIYGVVDVNLQRLSNSGGASVTRIHNSGHSGSRLGFRGQENLGGGMFAGFWWEAGVNADDGSGVTTGTNNQGATTGGGGITMNRRATLHLGGNWGEIRLGRDLSPQYRNITGFDPFTSLGVGANIAARTLITGGASVRSSNTIYYFTPRMAGFQLEVAHYRGENLSTAVNADDGNGWAGRLHYASGPFTASAQFSRTDRLAGDYKQDNYGANYRIGKGIIMGHLTTDEAGTTKARGYLIGGRLEVGNGELRGSISGVKIDPAGAGADPKTRKIAIGYTHNLSKRTGIYATYARVTNSSGAAVPVNAGAGNPAPNGSGSGFDLGLKHTF